MRGGLRQPVIEAAVNDQVFAHWAGKGPKIAHGIAAKKGLRKMPDFGGQDEFSKRM